MPPAGRKSRPVVVTGDVTVDWNITRLVPDGGAQPPWSAGDTVRACWQRGGAAMVADVIAAMTRQLEVASGLGFPVTPVAFPRRRPHPLDTHLHHSYAMWAPYPRDSSNSGDRTRVWRVADFLGTNRGAQHGLPLAGEEPKHPCLVVLDDAGHGFREAPPLWPRSLEMDPPPDWVLLKMASPVAAGPLWGSLIKRHPDRLVVVMTVGDLRQTQVHISRELSWERTAQDLFWELTHNPVLEGLANCRHTVVSLGPAGALLLSRGDGGAEDAEGSRWSCRLYFDPHVFEGAWGSEHPGRMVGFTTCLTAGIARQLLLSPADPDLGAGIQSGVAAMRGLQRLGYGEVGQPRGAVTFPLREVVTTLAGDEEPLANAEVQDPVRFLRTARPAPPRAGTPGFWTILDDVCHGGACRAGAGGWPQTLLELATDIVRRGPAKALRGVPLGKFGAFVTADRREVEAFRAAGALIAEYRGRRNDTPLSIAVFGPPGSGKSFGVTQVARSVAGDEFKDLTFNLSQFSGPRDLIQALHQVRDVGLSGKIPLVFWDEFDTALDNVPLGWLRYFLAPMQDGVFQEGQITHPIGRAIFVFAGGTRSSLAGFEVAPGKPGYEDFVQAKGPDFVSRLKGYINILGPNQSTDPSLGGDPHYLVRRAIALRGMLERLAGHLFTEGRGKGEPRIDPGVLRAFLDVSAYRHGLRSVKSVIEMSALAGRTIFERSCLPSGAQLGLHVRGREFLALVQAPELSGDLLERLAAAAHEAYCAQLQSDPEAPPHARVAYQDLVETFGPELGEHYRNLCRENVGHIAAKLARVGCVMAPARSDDPPWFFPGDDLELLAEMEHDRWMAQKVASGWQYGAERDEQALLNPALLPWQAMTRAELVQRYGSELAAAMGTETLPESEKEKDRALVREIPDLLARAGYTIISLEP